LILIGRVRLNRRLSRAQTSAVFSFRFRDYTATGRSGPSYSGALWSPHTSVTRTLWCTTKSRLCTVESTRRRLSSCKLAINAARHGLAAAKS